MSKAPFSQNKNYENHPNRTACDLSHTNNLTLNMGELVPFLCLPTLPGDTHTIDIAAALRTLPLSFPIQSKCKVYFHLFYQRDPNLWPGFYDFIAGNDKLMGKDLIPPTIDFNGRDKVNSSLLQTGSLGDYLGLPTVSYLSDILDSGSVFISPELSSTSPSEYQLPQFGYQVWSSISQWFTNVPWLDPSKMNFGPPTGRFWNYIPFQLDTAARNRPLHIQVDLPVEYLSFDLNNLYVIVPTDNSSPEKNVLITPKVSQVFNDGELFNRVSFAFEDPNILHGSVSFYLALISTYASAPGILYKSKIFVTSFSETVSDAINTNQGNNIQKMSQQMPISALPFRCYESIYNAFYRDDRNNPLMDGEYPVFNKYVTTDEGGLDSTPYHLFYRNWEQDQFTTCVKSPQQGVAPLVGISSLGDVTFAHEGREYTFSTETADDASTITKINVTEDVPNAVARAIVNTVTSGISINDFRNVNSFQRWLETNIRRGMKAKDQTLARWGVAPKDAVLGMPEFIGGFSLDLDINTVMNTSAQGDVPLGDYAGSGSCFGGSRHKITHFCDYYGFIMGIVSIVPVPSYSQLVPKHFFYQSALDWYSPEFANLGLQPVLYRELCPLECGTDSQTDRPKPLDVFGYQRPWYEYMSMNDTVHGMFRNDFSNFLLTRQFVRPPYLNDEFLTVRPDSLNNVWSVDSRHKFLGQIRMNIESKRPVPAYSIPSIS